MTRKEREIINSILGDLFEIHGLMRKRNKGTDGLEMMAIRLRNRLIADALKHNKRQSRAA